MGFLDAFSGGGNSQDGINNVGTVLGAIGAGLLTGDRYNPIGPGFLASMQANQKGGLPRSALKQILMQAGYSDAEAEKLSATEGTAKLALDQKKEENFNSFLGGAFGSGTSNLGMGASPRTSPAAPGGPAAGASLNGNGLAPPTGTTAEIQNKFVGALKDGGLTNPFGLGAVAAYAQHESRYSPQNIVGSWSDPSESGQAGTSGGILSWRDDRLAKMRAATAGAKDPVVAQAQFTLAENPELTAKLQNAKSAEEANALMADAWKFAGYNRQGGEYANRLATTQSYANRFGQTRTADASGAIPQAMPPGASGLNPGQKVDVANNENDTQVLEGRMGMYPPNVYGVAKPATQTADAANIPSPDAIPAEFRIPPGSGGQGQPPYAPDSVTAKAIAARRANAADEDRAKVQRGLAIIAQSGQFGDRGKAVAEAIKLQIQPLLKNMEETDAQKLVKAADLPDDQARSVLAGAIPGNAPTSLQKDYASYRTQEIGEGRVPLSQLDFDLKLRREAKADINIRNDAEKKEEVGRAESVTKFLGGIADSAPATAKRAASLDQLGRLISRTSTAQGTTLRAQLDGIGKELGLSSGELKTKTDAINAIVNSLAPQMREPGSGTVSDADLRGFLAALPNLSATPEGNQLILAGLKRATDVDRERTKIAAQWQSGKISASDARAKIAEIDERSIYASEAERSLVSGLSPIPDNKAKPGWRVLGVE